MRACLANVNEIIMKILRHGKWYIMKTSKLLTFSTLEYTKCIGIEKSKYKKSNPVCAKTHKHLILKEIWHVILKHKQYRFVKKKRKKKKSICGASVTHWQIWAQVKVQTAKLIICITQGTLIAWWCCESWAKKPINMVQCAARENYCESVHGGKWYELGGKWAAV